MPKLAILRLTGPHDRLTVGFTYVSADRFPVRRNLIEFWHGLILRKTLRTTMWKTLGQSEQNS